MTTIYCGLPVVFSLPDNFGVSVLVLFIFFLSCVFVLVLMLFVITLKPSKYRYTIIPNSTIQNAITFNYTTPNYHNQIISTTHFNYSGVCSNVFKYQPNNKRDLWLTAVGVTSDSYYKKIMKDVPLVLGLAHSSIPHADKVIILFKGYNYSELITLAHKNGFKTLEVDMSYIKKCQDASKRFFAFKEYIQNNTEKYDRVLISDFRDVFIFADFFATFSSNDLFFTPECTYGGKSCVTLNEWSNKIWMRKGFGQKVSDGYVKNSSLLINVGTTFGGTEQVLNYVKLMTETMKPERYSEWGHDQAVHNYIFYTHYFNQRYNFYIENLKEKTIENTHKNYILDRCSQRFCFKEIGTIVYDSQKKTLFTKETRCAPVLRHKISAYGLKLDWDGVAQNL
ncbi:hypothetical protein EIN_116470 [Entamoeba invadens IP1]|uniref:Uncharacterized protein n=1 Tax=Entamoeba invadens IP1 TaxID=370355 RepID=L7FNQ2_ENTIV|nr:hypothetical protein EIN_116470 [Entamoeba invadens IP1]ELP94536.1 hypothetical protein EIN_116470 [Entamoeba invadens IP1]|eukprot:XP_004261307.1 hypothetical protein EIN_116470 [Entamoeba invadens IP1]